MIKKTFILKLPSALEPPHLSDDFELQNAWCWWFSEKAIAFFQT
ncbi:hypothetical protein ECRN5871_1632 [Escherichia coli RN587/1]|nr:hypothetical protein ECRN5871_1632 [Escherichia coli RN587/1]